MVLLRCGIGIWGFRGRVVSESGTLSRMNGATRGRPPPMGIHVEYASQPQEERKGAWRHDPAVDSSRRLTWHLPPWRNPPSPLGGTIFSLIPSSHNTKSEGQALGVSPGQTRGLPINKLVAA